MLGRDQKLSEFASAAGRTVIVYGTQDLFESKDFTPGQEAVRKLSYGEVTLEIGHYDMYLFGTLLHAQNIERYRNEIFSPHPEAIDETIAEAYFLAECAVQRMEYGFETTSFEEAAHNAYEFYQSRVGYF